MFFFFAVRYFSDPLSKKHHFGLMDEQDPNAIFSLQKMAPTFTKKNRESHARLSQTSSLTLKELLSDGWLKSDARTLLRKPYFLFRDYIDEEEEDLYDGNFKWLYHIGNRCFFLLNMERMFPLSCLQSMSLCRQMDWELTKE